MRFKVVLLLVCSFLSYSLEKSILLKTKIYEVNYEKNCYKKEYEIFFLDDGKKKIMKDKDFELEFDYDFFMLEEILKKIDGKDLKEVENSYDEWLSDKSICQLEKEEFNNWEIFNELNWPKIIIKEKIFEIEFKENILLLSADSLKYKSENIKKILEFIRLNQLGVSIN